MIKQDVKKRKFFIQIIPNTVKYMCFWFIIPHPLSHAA